MAPETGEEELPMPSNYVGGELGKKSSKTVDGQRYFLVKLKYRAPLYPAITAASACRSSLYSIL